MGVTVLTASGMYYLTLVKIDDFILRRRGHHQGNKQYSVHAAEGQSLNLTWRLIQAAVLTVCGM